LRNLGGGLFRAPPSSEIDKVVADSLSRFSIGPIFFDVIGGRAATDGWHP
jgi:hypothetical protein